MQKIIIILSAISGALYLVLAVINWRMSKRKTNQAKKSPRPAHFWGLLFAVLYYYGFPLWWWRYGLRRTLYLMVVCVGAGILIQELIRQLTGESNAVGFLIALPIRAAVGLWVAKRDDAWKKSIAAIRNSKPHPDVAKS